MIKTIFAVGSFLLLLMTLTVAAQECRDDVNATTPDNRFSLNGDEVIDNNTGLIWQRCSFGLSGENCLIGAGHPDTWSGVLRVAENLR